MPRERDDESLRPMLRDTDDELPSNIRTDDNEFEEHNIGCAGTACCNPSSRLHRFIALIFMCLIGFGE